MAVKTFSPPHFPPARGYSNGARGWGREMLAVAGQIAWDSDGKIVSDDFAAQFDQALANVVDVVRSGGLTPNDVLQMRIYVTDKKEYMAATKKVGAAWRKHMGRHYPAMALVQVAALLEEGAKVEIEALCIKAIA